MKYMMVVNQKEMIEEVLELCDAFLFGIQDYSVNFPYYVSLNELKELLPILKLKKKEVFVSLNKNFHHEELEGLKQLLNELKTLEIDGIFYYDVALVTLKKEGMIPFPLIWSQEHLTTNYDTCNFWQKQGVDMALLSGEITLDEILEIRKHTIMKLIVPIFGYLPMFVSKRHLVKNYLEKFQLSKNDTTYFIKKEGNTYPIIDHKYGTEVYSASILNGLTESTILKEENIDYGLITSFMIETDDMVTILKKFHEVDKTTAPKLEEEINLLLEKPTDKGFFYKETVFRVKKYEK